LVGSPPGAVVGCSNRNRDGSSRVVVAASRVLVVAGIGVAVIAGVGVALIALVSGVGGLAVFAVAVGWLGRAIVRLGVGGSVSRNLSGGGLGLEAVEVGRVVGVNLVIVGVAAMRRAAGGIVGLVAGGEGATSGVGGVDTLSTVLSGSGLRWRGPAGQGVSMGGGTMSVTTMAVAGGVARAVTGGSWVVCRSRAGVKLALGSERPEVTTPLSGLSGSGSDCKSNGEVREHCVLKFKSINSVNLLRAYISSL